MRLLAVDILSFVVSKFRKPRSLNTKLRRILIATPAHLGDAVILTAIIRALKDRIPTLEIEVLCGSWSKIIFQGHPGVSRIHCVDHPMCNRSEGSRQTKFTHYQGTLTLALKSLNQHPYDLAVLAYAFEPSFIPLLLRLQQSPPLVGFISAGYGSLLSKSYGHGPLDWHEVQHQAMLFETWLDSSLPAAHYRPWLPDYEYEVFPDEICDRSYVVVHPGTGSTAKEWPVKNWGAVIDFLLGQNRCVVVTGQGNREAEIAVKVAGGRRVINLVNRLTFPQFCRVVAKTDLLVGVDSVAGHVAAAYERPGVIVASGTSDIRRWHPLSEKVHVLTQPMSCSPCHSRPCATRPCITDITAGAVLDRIKKVLP